MKQKIDHWLDSFAKFHQQYIIVTTEYSNVSVPEESIYIALVQENETRCYFNVTI